MTRPLVFLVAALAVVAAAAGCEQKDETKPPVKRYQVRGQVDVIQEGKLYVTHEAMPDFVGRSGKVVGMESMQMPFGVASRIDTSELAVGDKVEMTVEADFGEDPPLIIVALEELPADTALELAR